MQSDIQSSPINEDNNYLTVIGLQQPASLDSRLRNHDSSSEVYSIAIYYRPNQKHFQAKDHSKTCIFVKRTLRKRWTHVRKNKSAIFDLLSSLNCVIHLNKGAIQMYATSTIQHVIKLHRTENSGSFGTVHPGCLRPENSGCFGTVHPGSLSVLAGTVSSDSATEASDMARYLLSWNCFRQQQSRPSTPSTSGGMKFSTRRNTFLTGTTKTIQFT